MRDVLRGEWAATFVATPSGEPFSGAWWRDKAAGGAVEFAAWSLNGGLTLAGKAATGRTRPDKSDDESLPSGHASEAFALATLGNRNLDAIDLDPRLRTTWQAANVALAATTAWARVEGRKHFPSDVLAGAALGRFVSAVVHDSWLGEEPQALELDAGAGPHGVSVRLGWRF